MDCFLINQEIISKPIEQCTGQEITQELLYHLGVRKVERISEESATTIPVYMPFITSYFMLREPGDRPLVVPNGSKILLSLGTSQILNEIRCLQQSILYGQRWKLFINC